MRDKRSVLLGLFLAAMLCAVPAIAQEAESAPAGDPFEWTNGYALILTSDLTYDEANETVDFISDHGGQVAIIVSPRMLLGWAGASLVGQHGIVAVHTRQVAPGQLRRLNIDEAQHLEFFNAVASGAWKSEKEKTYAPMDWHGPADMVTRPAALGAPSAAPGIELDFPGTSDMMAGKVRYNVFFVESAPGVEDFYSWTCADLTTAVSEISAGLSFWSSRASTYGTPLTFSIGYQRPIVKSGLTTLCSGTTKVIQPYEPVRHPGAGGAYDGDGLWVNPIMANFGYGVGDKWTRVNNYNGWSRTYYKTNWATSLFVGYNPAGAPTSFTNGYFAYAWVPNGPYSQLLWRNNGWLITDLDRIVSHETGHLFGADDEYDSSGCNNCNSSDASSKYVINGNCENCNPSHVGCIMNHNESTLCGYTPGQLGWGIKFNSLKATTVIYGSTEKTNYKPGQTVYYTINIDVPGLPGQCVNVMSRWYRQFQSNLTESESFDQPCLITSGGNRIISLTRTIPAGAQFGEAAFEVQLELDYAAPYMYGKGVRASTKGKMFILNGSANAILTSPDLVSGPPVAVEGIKK